MVSGAIQIYTIIPHLRNMKMKEYEHLVAAGRLRTKARIHKYRKNRKMNIYMYM